MTERRPLRRRANKSVPGKRAVKKELARVLSKLGVASRTVAAEWIKAGRVKVNGRVVWDPATPIDGDPAAIEVDDRRVEAQQRVYYALNKPRGLITSASDEHGRATVFQCFDPPPPCPIFPVGRLDKASEGLLLFTNDTTWANVLTAPDCHVEKRYHVQVNPLPDAEALGRLRAGVRDDNEIELKAKRVELLRAGEKNGWLEITLTEGRNRHIRRMLDLCGFKVLRLIRVAIGPLELGDLAKGKVRELSRREVNALATVGANHCGSGSFRDSNQR